jgi:hypothetical protein
MAKERKEVGTKVPSTQCCATAQNTFLQKKKQLRTPSNAASGTAASN